MASLLGDTIYRYDTDVKPYIVTANLFLLGIYISVFLVVFQVVSIRFLNNKIDETEWTSTRSSPARLNPLLEEVVNALNMLYIYSIALGVTLFVSVVLYRHNQLSLFGFLGALAVVGLSGMMIADVMELKAYVGSSLIWEKYAGSGNRRITRKLDYVREQGDNMLTYCLILIGIFSLFGMKGMYTYYRNRKMVENYDYY